MWGGGILSVFYNWWLCPVFLSVHGLITHNFVRHKEGPLLKPGNLYFFSPTSNYSSVEVQLFRLFLLLLWECCFWNQQMDVLWGENNHLRRLSDWFIRALSLTEFLLWSVLHTSQTYRYRFHSQIGWADAHNRINFSLICCNKIFIAKLCLFVNLGVTHRLVVWKNGGCGDR